MKKPPGPARATGGMEIYERSVFYRRLKAQSLILINLAHPDHAQARRRSEPVRDLNSSM